MSAVEAIPVTVLGGYLGAGKTTLVNHLLREANGLRIAVLVNDFGELPIDADLIEAEEDSVLSIAGGCICCSYGSDLMATLQSLHVHPSRPQHVLIEASGVALPKPIADSVGLLPTLQLDGIVVLTDADTVLARAGDPYLGDTIERQLNDADLVILNKVDLVGDEKLAAVHGWLDELRPALKCIESVHARVPKAALLSAVEDPAVQIAASSGSPHVHYQSLLLSCDEVADAHAFAACLARPELGLLRVKGFIEDVNGCIHRIQVVGHRGKAEPITTPPRTVGKLVAIGLAQRMDIAGVAACDGVAGVLMRSDD